MFKNRILPLITLVLVITYSDTFALGPGVSIPKAGFSLPDSIEEVTVRYKRANNLILLPVTINDSLHVNLILDTGCRNVVLFGKRFLKEFQINPDKRVEFSGLGSGNSISGRIALGNKVAIDAVLGERIPVVIVPNPNLFGSYSGVDGIIGYDIFIKFEIELHNSQQLITFRPAQTAQLPDDYNLIPIRVEDSRPIIQSTISIQGKEESMDIMIDTGSSLGLLLKTNEGTALFKNVKQTILGRGLNGPIEGVNVRADGVRLHDFLLRRVPVGVVHSAWSGMPSIGMDVLGEYSLVLNYCKGYAGLKNSTTSAITELKRSNRTAYADF
ncbi:aspartyl protease family protein [Chryseolinea sp. T2]|uniref:aspartyl protease family protein n=1 Tax=Chryseolinea sp. T2 TaxID=3129255 RepID=UPI003077B137